MGRVDSLEKTLMLGWIEGEEEEELEDVTEEITEETDAPAE